MQRGIAADVVTAWHGHTERMTQAVYGRMTDDHLTAAAGIFFPSGTDRVRRRGVQRPIRLTNKTRSDAGQNGFSTWS
jgi:hypothetical protein